MAISDITLEKTLPHSLEAERAVLGAVLLDNQVFDQAAELLTLKDFHSEGHQKIFAQMEALAAASRPIDSVTLREELEREGHLETAGGIAYLASLVDGVPRISNLTEYAQIVKEKSILRKLIHATNEILIRGYSGEDDPVSLLDEAERTIFEISQERDHRGFASLPDLLSTAWEHIETLEERKELVTGIPTGYHELDEMTSGLQPSDLVILAGRPGMGKTSLALNIGQHAAIKEGKTVGVFSLEMSSQQLVMRLLCGEARVDSHRVRSGYLSNDDWGDLAKAMSRLSEAKIFIDDTPAMSVIEIRSKSRRLKSEHGLDLLVIDYLQLMSGAAGRSLRFENRQQEISAISRALKSLAKELNIPVLALSQLSRAPEQRRGDHRPQLSDLRESGSIEQDADVVLFVFREDLYRKEEDEEDSGVAEVIIGKQRNGPTGIVKLAFIDQWTRFENLAPGRR